MVGRWIAVFLVVVLTRTGAAASEAVYTLAVVPQFDLRQIQSTWAPLVNRLQSATGARFTLVTEANIPSFEKNLNAGTYDFAYANPFHYVVAHRRHGYRPLVRDHEGPLSGIIVVRRNSGLTDISMLKGRTVAFPAPNAFGAALIPRAEFARKYGISIVESYVKSHESAYLNVLLGLADAAGGITATFEKQKPEIRDGLVVIHETDRYAPHPLAVHPRVPKDIADKVRDELIRAGAETEGAQLLAKIPINRAGIATDSDYDQVRALGLEAFYVEQ